MLAFRITTCALFALPARAGDRPVVGPANGSLLAVGGGRLTPEIVERFIELAGGRDSAFVIIPTAEGAEKPPGPEASFLKRAGCQDVVVLHTNDRIVAESEEFVRPLQRARGIWIGGGQKWRVVGSYLHSR